MELTAMGETGHDRGTMRMLSLILWGLVLVTPALPAETPGALPGFLGIPWEASRADAVKLLQTQKDLKFARTEPAGLVYFGTYQGHPAEVELVFTGDRFCLGLVALQAQAPAVNDLFLTVAAEVGAQVGTGPSATSSPPDPPSSRWVFADGNYILLVVNRQPLQLLLVYADQALAAQAAGGRP
jgi:hypothetical protein